MLASTLTKPAARFKDSCEAIGEQGAKNDSSSLVWGDLEPFSPGTDASMG
jgi:hypothetical protein